MATKNAWGLDAHPTDDMIDPLDVRLDSEGQVTEQSVEMIQNLRNAYDAIVNAGLKKELEVCMDQAYHQGVEHEGDRMTTAFRL